jgi:HK97 family phage major capsid protein
MSAAQSRHVIDLAAPEFRGMQRTFAVEREGIDKQARTVELSFASETPVERWFGREILDLTPQACDMSRLLNGGAVLVNHDWDDQVGVVVDARIDPATKKARAKVKFSQSVRGSEIFQDITDGIRSLVSVGYIVRKMVLQAVEGDMETHRVTDWQPFEISLVAVPADPAVGVGRSQPNPAQPVSSNRQPISSMSATAIENNPTPAAAPVVTGVRDHTAERDRSKAIIASSRALAEKYPQHAEAIRSIADKCIETGDNADALSRAVLNDVLGAERALAPVRQGGADIGLSKKDQKRYSVLRAIRAAAEGKPLDGLERECSDEVAKKLERAPRGFFMPDEVAHGHRLSGLRTQANGAGRRDLNVTDPAAGGYTVGENILSNELVTLLRNQTKVVQLGARVISGLVGDVSIPRQLTGATAYWVSESGSLTQSAATFGQIVGKPRRIGTSVPYTKQFLAQTSLDAESFVTNDSDEAIAVDLDRVAIRGTGGSEPLGILNLASGDRSTSVTFGGAATWAKYLEFFGNVATSNALLGNPAYLTTPAAAVKAMSIARFTSGDSGIWDAAGKIGMFPAEWSNQFPTSGTVNQVIFGDFSQVLFLEWAGRDVVVDPFVGKKEGTVEVTIQRLIDMVIRRGKSFAISTDTAAA